MDLSKLKFDLSPTEQLLDGLRSRRDPMAQMREQLQDTLSTMASATHLALGHAESSALAAAKSCLAGVSSSDWVDALIGQGAAAQIEKQSLELQYVDHQDELSHAARSMMASEALQAMPSLAKSMVDSNLGITTAAAAADYLSVSCGYEQLLEQFRSLAGGSTLQTMLKDQAQYVERTLSELSGARQWENLVSPLRDAADRERKTWEQFLEQMTSAWGATIQTESWASKESVASLLGQTEVASVERMVHDAISALSSFQPSDFTPTTLQEITTTVSWSGLFDALRTHKREDHDKEETGGKIPARRRARPRLSKSDLMLAMTALGLFIDLMGLLFAAGLAQRFESRDAALPIRAENAASTHDWASTPIPTSLYASPSESSESLHRLPPGAWLRVLDERPDWLLVEVEVGDNSRVRGWIRSLAGRPVSEELQDLVFQSIHTAVSEQETSTIKTPPATEAPGLLLAAGEDAQLAYRHLFSLIKSPNTASAYARVYRRFSDFCDGTDVAIEQVNAIHVMAYLSQILHGDSPSTAKQHLIAIRKLFDHLQASGVVRVNPANKLKSPLPAVRDRKSVHATELDVEQLLASISGDRPIDVRDRAIIAMIWTGRLKVSEIARLTIEDVEEQASALVVWVGPSSKRAQIELPEPALSNVRRHLAMRRQSKSDDPLFASARASLGRQNDSGRPLRREEIYAMIRRRAEACGLVGMSCEKLRRAGR